MRRITLTATALVTLLGAGCVGGLEPAGDDTGDDDTTPAATLGRMNYDTNVAPVMAVCASCHQSAGPGTPFLGANGATDDYASLTGTQFRVIIGDFNPAQAPLLTYGASPTHSGPELTTTQVDVIETWLVQEAMDRDIDISGTPPPGPVGQISSRQALAKFAACMVVGDWDANINNRTMGDWNDKGTNNGEQCKNCHMETGAGGYYTSNTSSTMFEMNRTELFIRAFFTTTPVDPTNPMSDFKVVPNMPKLIAKGSGAGGLHPNYNVDPTDSYFVRLTAFYDATTARLPGCTAPAVFPTPP
jgi:hypothetical protein